MFTELATNMDIELFVSINVAIKIRKRNQLKDHIIEELESDGIIGPIHLYRILEMEMI